MNTSEPRQIRKIVLIEPKAPGFHVFSRYKLPRLGLPLLGAVLEQELGASVKIYFQECAKIDWDEVMKADLVGISTITSTAPAAYSLVERIKKTCDATVVMGGPHVTFLPDEALEHGADFVVRGEGEESLVELIRCLTGEAGSLGDIGGLSYRVEGQTVNNPEREWIGDLSALPWPKLSLIQGFEKRAIIPIMTSRGCPFNCKFCTVTSLFGRKYRFRDTDDVMAELEALYALYPKAVYFFYDDNFTAKPEHTKELLRRMKEKGITPRWTAQARVDVVHDEELMQLMEDTNCLFLYLGLESANPETLKAYRKQQTVQDIEQAVGIIHKHRIKVHGMFVMGADEDDKESIRETVRFTKRTGIDTVQFMILTPIPGSETYDDMCREGRIFVHDWTKFSGQHVVFRPKKMAPYKLQKEAGIKATRKFYSVAQCWKLGLSFRWRDMAIRIYGHRTLIKWKSRNRYYVSELKHRYKAERAHRKQEERDLEALGGSGQETARGRKGGDSRQPASI
jgi:anaerobic magnesium-protoporphyrin IX monomethyl ester cyclase